MDNADVCEVLEEPYQDPETELKAVVKEIGKVIRDIQLLEGRKHKLEKRRDQLKDAIQQQNSAALAQKDWERQDFSWSDKLEDMRKRIFNIPKLRPYQLPTMNATLSGTDCILIMPTGGGKSLCYQLPALVSKGITLVVSPLISLMEDQLFGLKANGVDARMLSADTEKEEVAVIYNAMTDPKAPVKLLYVTPERLAKSKRFMTKLQKMYQLGLFARLAIDEVHCCSQWGHDFRPDYKFLGVMRKMFPSVPILGLTATATSRVITDVQKILNLQGCLILKASFNRPNLFYEVRPKPPTSAGCIDELEKLLKGEFKGQSGIIYTLSIKDTEELANELKGREVKVAPYHAMLEAGTRSKIHKKWVQNIYQVVVATIAFGMGIDKPDVRFVIHHCISKSMENFYQESGRAGRDGNPAKCIVFWRFSDFARQSTMVFTEQTGLENLYGLITYCLDGTRCRRNIIAEHFDERWDSSDCNGMCDHCRTPREVKNLDLKDHAEKLMLILTKALSKDQRLTGQKLIDAWLGKGPKDVRVPEAIEKDMSRERAENIVAFFILDSFLKEDFHFTPYSTISYIVAGPKAEAGLTPSQMPVGGFRKDTPYGDSDMKTLFKEKSSEPKKVDGQNEQPRSSESNVASEKKISSSSHSKGSTNSKMSSANNSSSKTSRTSSSSSKEKSSSSSKEKSSSSSSSKMNISSSSTKSSHASKNDHKRSSDPPLKKQKVSRDGEGLEINHSRKPTSFALDDENDFKSESESESSSGKRKRIITIEDSSDSDIGS